MSNRIFFYPDFRRYVLLTAPALEQMYKHTQKRFWQTEAGGEVYTTAPDTHGLIISNALGPNEGDHRTRCSYNPNIQAVMRDRQQQYGLGRHAVGLWHTHPEKHPVPSGKDKSTTEEYLRAFKGDRESYLMVILGNHGDLPVISVWAISNCWIELKEVPILRQ